MRFFLMFIFLVILTYGPGLFYAFFKNGKKLLKWLLLVIPSLFMLFYGLMMMKVIPIDSMTMCIINMTFIICMLPVDILFLFKGIYLLIEKYKGKKIKWLNSLGVGFSILVFIILLIGVCERKNIMVRETQVEIQNWPEAYDGLKILQITDVHLGNIDGLEEYLEIMVEHCNEQNPDIVFLTGDLVNIKADEGLPALGIMNKLEAKIGKYAVLGNHDYGKYYNWVSDKDSIENMNAVKKLYRDLGFDLLLNENRILTNGMDSIAIVGTENCGEEPFPCYADLPQAMLGVENLPAILMTHDPSHWRNEVLSFHNIKLTCSGHTHGAQMGIDCGTVKFSPAQFMYKDWDGLYADSPTSGSSPNQYLFISRGIGYVGIPFRLGMRPEISVITLVKH